MRYLGVDYGARRIGLALSDGTGRVGLPYGTVASIAEVIAVIRTEAPAAVVVGLPALPGRRESPQARAIRAFAARLGEAVQLPIVFEDEAFTTKIAERHAPPHAADAAAAALILQSYLDRQRTP